jgi:flagellar biosynthesis protein FlhF
MTMNRTFRGRTLSEARDAAEAALGPDVVVLERRRVKQKGISGLLGATEFEIEVGTSVTTPMLSEALEEAPVARGYSHSRPSPRETSPSLQFARAVYEEAEEQERGSGRASTADIARLENEVRAVRAMLYRMSNSPDKLQSQLQSLRRAVDEMVPRTSAPERVGRLVERSGLSGAPARAVEKRLRRHEGDDESLLEAYRDALADLIRVRAWPLAGDDKRVIALVGPPGVGKTTTAAKLAASAIANGNTVTFVGCDTYRVGAVEQLESYAVLLGCECIIVTTQAELHQAIREATSDIVIVDTSGRGPEGEQSVELALGDGRLRGQPTGWEHRSRYVLLCLDASLRFADATELCQRYAGCNPTAIAVTKLDMTSAPGGLVHGSATTELPIALLCNGQRVPEDIAPATAGRILDYLAPRHRLAN